MTYTLSGSRKNAAGSQASISFTFNTANDGNIITENFPKEATLTPMPLYGLNSNETQVFDFGGCTRMITIDVVKNETPTNIETFITKLMRLIDGEQDTALTYVSTILGTIYVKVSRIDATYIGGNIRTLAYTLQLIESDRIG